MADETFITSYLTQYFDEVSPKEFYRAVFPVGELQEKGKLTKGKYNAIAVELLPQENEKQNVRKFIITDELDMVDELITHDNFIIVSPILYIGRSRESKNARYVYALTIDLDGISKPQQLTDLFYQIDNEVLPKPTYVVSSGYGLHLYYVFVSAIPCFNNIIKQLAELKKGLTKRIWNKYITDFYEKPQIQSLFQGFRMVGTITKNKHRTRAFITGEKIDIDYLNNFVDEMQQVKQLRYKSKLSLQEAAAKYPEWFEKRIINKQPKGTWTCKRDLYDWWLRKLRAEIAVGHRYFGIMCLCVYAKKCNIPKEELEKDAFSLLEAMEKLTTDDKNHFTREDILAALEMYNDNYITFPINSISTLTNIKIEKNKRNGRKQKDHIDYMNSIRTFKLQHNEPMKIGRPCRKEEIIRWRAENPTGSKADCIKETGISKPTVYKYWEMQTN